MSTYTQRSTLDVDGYGQRSSSARRSPVHIGRLRLLAIAFGVGATVAVAPAVANADEQTSNDSSKTASAVSAKPNGPRAPERSTPTTSRSGGDADGPASVPSGTGPRRAGSEQARATASTEIEGARDAEIEVAPQAEPATETEQPTAPAPDDQATTEYGDIGKWMLDPRGDIAAYGGVPVDDKTVLEPVNVVIVDSVSKSAWEATWRLNSAMRRAGFPPRMIHSTGFRGLLDGRLYRQQPRGLLVGYSDNSFLRTNNHGRIFGPAPLRTEAGYVWSGAFSTEEWVVHNGLPRHGFVSANDARDALAAKMAAGGRATVAGMVPLGNAYTTATITTGDHDGFAVVLLLNVVGAVGVSSTSRTCAPAGYFTLARPSCGAVPALVGAE